ncbi:MAG: DNA alkylation repair protein [Clostridia bacterium]|nr:DNA alkylation repair protein [Clostridia bacterium]
MQSYSINEFEEFIKSNSEEKYRSFHSRLTRSNYPINGIRVPILRKYAKEIAKSKDVTDFLMQKPQCYEQCMLKGLLITHLKLDDKDFFPLLERYIGDIDDWALTDVVCSDIHRKDETYLAKVREYAGCKDIWFARWGIVAIMVNFFDKDQVIYETVDNLIAKDYYVDMALAWLIQVLAVKNKQVAISLMQSDKVSGQVKKLAVRKIKDSFRISKEDKEYFAQIIKT